MVLQIARGDELEDRKVAPRRLDTRAFEVSFRLAVLSALGRNFTENRVAVDESGRLARLLFGRYLHTYVTCSRPVPSGLGRQW